MSLYSNLKSSFEEDPLPNECTVYFDGSCRPNPGRMQIGVKIISKGFIKEISKKIGDGTNNIAELTAALVGIKVAVDNGFNNIYLRGDSTLAIKGISGDWCIKDDKLVPIMERIAIESKGIKIFPTWIPREKNTVADALSTK